MLGVGISKLKVTPLIFPTFLLQQFLPNQQQTNIFPPKKNMLDRRFSKKKLKLRSYIRLPVFDPGASPGGKTPPSFRKHQEPSEIENRTWQAGTVLRYQCQDPFTGAVWPNFMLPLKFAVFRRKKCMWMGIIMDNIYIYIYHRIFNKKKGHHGGGSRWGFWFWCDFFGGKDLDFQMIS